MKGIIVLDMPEYCTKCCFSHVSETNYKLFCGIVHKTIYGNSSKPDWCPIKPIPKRKTGRSLPEYDTDIHYEIGWNSCIDAIIGER